MKKIVSIIVLNFILLASCDFIGTYSFVIKNASDEIITLKFKNISSLSPEENKEIVVLLPSEEKKVRDVSGQLNSRSHDCFTKHGIAYFRELVFDTYVNGEKLEKQLWHAENWTYYSKSFMYGVYMMTITNEMIRNKLENNGIQN